MKVKCVRYFDSRRRPAIDSQWLTIDKVYHVMGIQKDANNKVDYLIVTNDLDPVPASVGFHPAEAFEVVSDVVPPNWKEHKSDSFVQVMPGSWLESNFFERFYDREQDAVSIFEEEREAILKSDP